MIRFQTNVGDLLDRYHEDYLVPNGRELHVNCHRLDMIRKMLGRDPVLTPSDIERFLKRHKTASRNRYRALLKSVFRWGAELGYVEGDLNIKSLKQTKETGERTRRMSPDEETRLRAVMGRDLTDLFTAAIDTGLRRGALLALQVSDAREGILNVPAAIQKHQQSQRIPLTARLGEIVGRRIHGRSDGLIFTVANFKDEWDRAREAAGVTNLHWHDLRGEFASRLSESGVEVAVISRLLGHASLDMTQKYLRPRLSQFGDAIKKLGV